MYKVTYRIRHEVRNAGFPLKEVFRLHKKTKLNVTKTNDNGKKKKGTG